MGAFFFIVYSCRMPNDMTISENIQSIQTDIAKICEEHNCDANKVHLVAVSKKQPDNRIQEALDAGQRLFGENRVQEAQDHWDARRGLYPDLKLHLIGPLQTNKVKDAVALFDVIETLDREKLARKLAAEMKEQGKDKREKAKQDTKKFESSGNDILSGGFDLGAFDPR